jgi:hypothetical protein
VQLAAGKNNEGYFHALEKVFDPDDRIPTPSALSQYRKNISYRFFRDAFIGSAAQAENLARTFRGRRVFGMDGFELNLPRSNDVLEHGYDGHFVSRHRKQYYPTMYTVFCSDVLSETIHAVRQSSHAGEGAMADEMIGELPEGSLCLYDRGFPSRKRMGAHFKAKNCFIFRLRTNSLPEGKQLLTQKFKTKKVTIEGHEVTIIKIRNTNTNEYSIYATNLPTSWIDEETISSLYKHRWECETLFLDLVNTIKTDQWHSLFLNGILQEFYAKLWLYNFTKLQILDTGQIDKNPLNEAYQKPNFKLILDWVIEKLPKILKRLLNPGPYIQKLVIKSTASRKRYSRFKMRTSKQPASPYPYDNTLWDPAFLT